MQTPTKKLQTEGIILKVFLVIMGLGLITTAYPLVMQVDDGNTIGIIVIGSFFTLMGLSGLVIMSGRHKKLSAMLSGEQVFDQWQDKEAGTIILSKLGFFWYGEFYTTKGYSCFVSNASIQGQCLHITYHTARKNGHAKHQAQIDIPLGHENAASQFCDYILNQK